MAGKDDLITPGDFVIPTFTPPSTITKNELETKRKPGRKKIYTEETKTINIVIPLSLYNKIEVAKLKYGNNLTKYVNEILSKDIEENYELYERLKNLLG